ncbi:MAG: MBL fold metallo-hydrolase [Edaphobacter sp.]
MKIEQFEIPGLAQYSYVVSSQGKAVVIDPIRDIDRYLDYAQRSSLSITHVLETHIHADYASGATALAQATGAELWLSGHDAGEDFQYGFPHHALRDGDILEVGTLSIQAIHTPGHTPEHLSFLLFDTERSAAAPVSLFSGDFLFVGSFGRPDLLGEGAKERLAAELYRSAHQRIGALPDGLEIYPAHGAGSLCGAGMGEQQQSTLGYERAANPLFALDESQFVAEILGSVPPFPDYYRRMKKLNSEGPPILKELPGEVPLTTAKLALLLKHEQITLLDLRRPAAFGGAHIPGSLNIGAGQNLSLWAGWMIDPEKPIVLINDGEDVEQSRRSLVRVGLDKIHGYLYGGIASWIDGGRELGHVPQRSVREVDAERGGGMVLDVRSNAEWKAGRIPEATHIMLGDLPKRLQELPRDTTLFVVCGSGYRSSIATSVLLSHGFSRVLNMSGGMGAWNRQQMPVETSRSN